MSSIPDMVQLKINKQLAIERHGIGRHSNPSRVTKKRMIKRYINKTIYQYEYLRVSVDILLQVGEKTVCVAESVKILEAHVLCIPDFGGSIRHYITRNACKPWPMPS